MTFAAEEVGQILSRDARGRVLVSRERRESLLEEYDRSGMSGVKFAQYVGIKYSTLAYVWRCLGRGERSDGGIGKHLARERGLSYAQASGCPPIMLFLADS